MASWGILGSLRELRGSRHKKLNTWIFLFWYELTSKAGAGGG